jgi:Pectate lyase superfamily protein
MTIKKLVADYKGSPNNSKGKDIRDSVNQLIETHVSCLKSLPAEYAANTETVYTVIGFYAGSTSGGGKFIYDPNKSKALHNGGTVIAPEALLAWDGSATNLSTLLNWVGSGSGCFVKLVNIFSVRDFGAKGDAVVDDTLPVRKAIRAAVNVTGFSNDGDPTGSVYFPAGVYRITESGVFSDYGDSKRNGVKSYGDGPDNTIVWLDPSALATSAWFYDNGATVRAWNATFRDMSFHGGTTWRTLSQNYSNFNNKVNGFRFTGPAWESGHVFDNVTFAWLDTVLSVDGTNNADTIRFSNCTAIKCRRANYINNPQSMNITWDQCYLSNQFGDFVEWGSGVFGGGNFALTNSTIVFTPDDFGAGTSNIFNIVSGGTATANAPVSFSNTRFEIKGVGAKIGSVSGGSTMVMFYGCSFLSTTATTRDIATVGGYCSLFFDKCSFAPQGNGIANWILQSTNRAAKQASIKFSNCNLSKWDTLHTIQFSGNRGYVELEGCWEEFVDYPNFPTPMVRAINGVYKGSDKGQNTGFRQTKTYVVDPLRAGLLPSTTANEALVTLPKGSVLCGATVVLLPNTPVATASQYRLLIGKSDKSVIYASSTVGAQNAGFVLNTKFAVPMGDAIEDRTVMLWGDNGSGGTSGAAAPAAAVCLLEYY